MYNVYAVNADFDYDKGNVQLRFILIDSEDFQLSLMLTVMMKSMFYSC